MERIYSIFQHWEVNEYCIYFIQVLSPDCLRDPFQTIHFEYVLWQVEDKRARRDAGNPGGEDDETGDGSSVFEGIFGRPNHPCNYFGLAKQAIFKCFGLDSSSSNHEHEKHEWCMLVYLIHVLNLSSSKNKTQTQTSTVAT